MCCVDYLSTPDKLEFQRNNWRAERVGWAALAAVVLAALLGLFGDGVLSNDEAASADGMLTVAYRRFLRAESPAKLEVTAAQALADGGRLAIRLDAAWLARFEIVAIEPEPESTTLAADRTTFLFATTAASATAATAGTTTAATASEPVTVRFRLEAEKAGVAVGAVGVGTAQIELRQFVYP